MRTFKIKFQNWKESALVILTESDLNIKGEDLESEWTLNSNQECRNVESIVDLTLYSEFNPCFEEL